GVPRKNKLENPRQQRVAVRPLRDELRREETEAVLAGAPADGHVGRRDALARTLHPRLDEAVRRVRWRRTAPELEAGEQRIQQPLEPRTDGRVVELCVRRERMHRLPGTLERPRG